MMKGQFLSGKCTCTVYSQSFPGGAFRFHRADLQQALTNGLSDRLRLSHRLVSYKEVGDEIHLTFQDGSSATCDLLIGIDGIKSVVRKCFLEKQGLLFSPSVNPVWTGTYAYRGLIPADELEKEFPGHRAMIMPVMVRKTFDLI
jgi:salicylate hydroxylase